ncbi:hypothetical protein AYO41_01415 [Verrucomicrobia bacterium SCGC AG-212-E04]|nr:hypothetical protein AYO41_01415 [Verrucomicrobia bacterium SCGC AG-212-E04]
MKHPLRTLSLFVFMVGIFAGGAGAADSGVKPTSDRNPLKSVNEALAARGLPAVTSEALGLGEADEANAGRWMTLSSGGKAGAKPVTFAPAIRPPLSVEAARRAPMDDASLAAARGITREELDRVRSLRGLSNEEVLTIRSAKLARAIRKTLQAKPDFPEEAMRYRESFLVDDKGLIDPARVKLAIEQARATPLNSRLLPAFNRITNRVETNSLDPNGWTWKGPGNIGGRTRSLVIHPTQTSRMWAGSVGGGIWYSSNGGTSWAPVNDFMANLSVSTLIIDPTNANTMYAGTGEGFFNADGVRGAGVFKSIDGGVTWNQLANTATSDFYFVNRLALSPNGATLLAATATGIWRSINGGTNWTLAQSTTGRMAQVAFDPNDSLKAVATGYSALAYYSTDGGATWNVGTGLGAFGGTLGGRSEFAYAKSAAGTIYLGYWTGTTAQLYKSTNGGQTYTQVTVSGGTNWMSAQGWYDNTIWVDPTNANTLIVGGLDLYRSTNGGTTLNKISTWQSAPLSAHADHHGIFADPGYDAVNNKRIYFTNDGGVYKADNALTVVNTTGWQELNNNYGVTQFYGGAGNATTGVFVAGAQDNGTLRFTPANGTEGWTTMFGGDGGNCAADPQNSNYFYGEYVYCEIHRSANGGASSSYIYTGMTGAGVSTTSEFIAPFILDPNNPLTLLAGTQTLNRTTNARAGTVTWSSIKAVDGSGSNANITAIAVAPGNSDLIWVGHRGGNIWMTTNGTNASPSWTKVNTAAMPARRVTRLVIDPNQTSRVYACFGGFAADNLWVTTNSGANWSNATGTLPGAPIYGMVIRPDDSNTLFAGTDVGVFASEDRGVTWSTTNLGPSFASVSEILFVGSDLFIVTHGRGVFSYPVLPPPPDITPPTLTITPDGTVTNASPVNFRFSFSEPVVGFSSASISVTGGTKGTMTGSGANYTLPVTPLISGNTLTVSVPSNSAQDGAGNPSNAASATAVTYDTASPFLYASQFDGAFAPTKWTFDGDWQWGVPTAGVGPGADHTGAGGKCFGTVLTGNYDDGQAAFLTAQPVTIPASGNPYYLRFWMWISAELDYDGGVLEASVNGGPFTVVPSASLSLPYNRPAVASFSGPAWSGETGLNAWNRVRVNLSAYAGSTVQFRFHFASDESVTAAGWYVDDFAIEQDPVVTLAATAPIAVEGGAPGTVRVQLQPKAPEGRSVNLAAPGGTAVSGTSYTALPGSVAVPAGSSGVNVNITPLSDGTTASRTETVILTLASGTDYLTSAPNSATVIIVGDSGYDAWRITKFSAAELLDPAISGPGANPTGDGVSNLLKYALGLDPHVANAGALPQPQFTNLSGLNYVTMNIVRPAGRTNVVYTAEVSGDLFTWSSAPVDVQTTIQPNVPSPGLETVTYRDLTPVDPSHVKRFMRVRVTFN